MKKLIVTFSLFPLFLPAFSFSSVKNVVENSENTTVTTSTETKAEGGNATTESTVSTTINGENVTVKTDQPGSVEVKNINGKVEIKTDGGITPTIITTGVPAENIKPEIKIEEEKSESPTTFSKIMNKQTRLIYTFFKGFLSRVFKPFLRKT